MSGVTDDWIKAQEMARRAVTAYLDREIDTMDFIAREVLPRTNTELALVVRILTAALGDVFDDADEWSRYVLRGLAAQRMCSSGHLLGPDGEHWFESESGCEQTS